MFPFLHKFLMCHTYLNPGQIVPMFPRLMTIHTAYITVKHLDLLTHPTHHLNSASSPISPDTFI